MNGGAIRRKLRNALFGGPAGGVFRSMTTLAVGGIAARVIGILSFPVITRLYSPHDFGIAALMLALRGCSRRFSRCGTRCRSLCPAATARR